TLGFCYHTRQHIKLLSFFSATSKSSLMADSSEQPPGFLEPLGGSTTHETLSALKYQPSPKQDDRLTCNMSGNFGMPDGLSVSWMKAILNPGSKPGDKSFVSALSLPAMNVPSLIYLTLPEDTTFTSGALGEPVQYADTTQGSAFVHSMPFRTAQPEHGAKPGPESLSSKTTQYQGASPATVTRHGKLDKGKAPAAPSVVDEQVDSGTEPLSAHKGPREVQGQEPELDSSDEEEDTRSLSTLSMQLKLVLDHFPMVTKKSMQKRLQLYVVKHLQLLAARGQHVSKSNLTEYIELFTRIYELELNEYIKRKLARETATSTATLAESVDYDAVLRQREPNIAEAMDMLNAPQQANESQQDFERQQNATWWQANTSRMPHQALSEVETATSYHAGDDEAEEPPEMRMPHRRVTIKEEERKESVPDEPVTQRRVAQRVHLMDNWNEHVNYQRICNQDLQEHRGSLIDNQGIVFEGHKAVTPIDNMRRQFVMRTGNKDHNSDCGQGCCTNNQRDRDCQDDWRPPGCQPDVPVPWVPQALHTKHRTEEPPYRATRTWSLPSPHDLRASMPGMNKVVKIHMDHMHDRLT
ncbi:hypothetical protein C0992_005037, partial [Termitomyces sp. T32_za158]